MVVERPPLYPLSAQNTGPTVIIVVYSLIAVSIFISAIRFSLSATRAIPFSGDDLAYLLANACAIVSSVLWHLAVIAGMGQHSASLSPISLDRFFKYAYAAQLVEVAAMFGAKVAFTLLADRIAPWRWHSKAVFLSVASAWAAFSLFALAFQCPFPAPWVFEPARCPTHGRLLYAIVAANALTDVALALWMVPIVWWLKMSRNKRLLVIALFGLRACILAPAITEISMMHIFLNNEDQSRVTVTRSILNQAIVYTSIVTAAVPRANQFIGRLHTNLHAGVSPEIEKEADLVKNRKSDSSPDQLEPPKCAVPSTSNDSSTDDHSEKFLNSTGSNHV